MDQDDYGTERDVLGCILRKPEVVSDVIEILGSDTKCFFNYETSKIYAAILKQESANGLIDINPLAEHGCPRPLMVAIIEDAIFPDRAVKYAKILRNKADKRHLSDDLKQLVSDIQNPDKSLEELVSDAEEVLAKVGQNSSNSGVERVGNVLDDVIQRLEDYEHQIKPPGTIYTGLPSVDGAVHGFEPTNFVLVAGWVGQGKSSFVDAIAVHNAVERETPVLIFSLEMSKKELGQKHLLRLAEVDSETAMRGEIRPYQWQEIAKQEGRLRTAPLYINSGTVSVPEIRSITKRHISKHGIKAIFVDYVQQIRVPNQPDKRLQVAQTSSELKALAMDLGIPVVGVSQLSFRPMHLKQLRPEMRDLAESKNLAMDPNIIMFVWHGKLKTPHGERDGSWVLIEKKRMGVGSDLEMSFAGGRWAEKENKQCERES